MENSPLARLPPEIRNRIYEYALREDTSVDLWRGRSDKVNGYRPICYGYTLVPGRRPMLHRTCKVLRQECSALFYAINTFQFFTYAEGDEVGSVTGLDCYKKFCTLIGPRNTDALRSITVHIDYISIPINPSAATTSKCAIRIKESVLEGLKHMPSDRDGAAVKFEFLFTHRSSYTPIGLNLDAHDMRQALEQQQDRLRDELRSRYARNVYFLRDIIAILHELQTLL